MAKGETTLLELEYISISGMFTNIVARWPGSTCVHRHAPCQLLHLNFKNMSVFLTRTSPLNCLPSPDYFPVELH